jgi:hypothetical protein
MKQAVVRLGDAHRRRLRIYAAAAETTVSAIVADALTCYFDRTRPLLADLVERAEQRAAQLNNPEESP